MTYVCAGAAYIGRSQGELGVGASIQRTRKNSESGVLQLPSIPLPAVPAGGAYENVDAPLPWFLTVYIATCDKIGGGAR